jgi:hypothetical protein
MKNCDALLLVHVLSPMMMMNKISYLLLLCVLLTATASSGSSFFKIFFIQPGFSQFPLACNKCEKNIVS